MPLNKETEPNRTNQITNTQGQTWKWFYTIERFKPCGESLWHRGESVGLRYSSNEFKPQFLHSFLD